MEEAYILLDITLVIVSAKLLEEAMARLRQPPLLGDLLAGMVLGPTFLGLIRVTENVRAIGWLGIVLLIFLAGMETSLEGLKRCSLSAASVAIGGVAATSTLAFVASTMLGYGWDTSLFMAVILAPTSVSVTVATLMELNMLRSRVGEVVVGAAVADDVYAMILFSVAYSILAGETGKYMVSLVCLGLVALTTIFIMLNRFCSTLIHVIVDKSKLADAPYTHILVIGLVASTVTALFKLSPIIGAYFAGLALSPLIRTRHLESYYRLLVEFISPFFFVYAGLLLDPWAIASRMDVSRALFVAAIIVSIGILGKILGCGIAAKMAGFDTRSSMAVGVAMMPRAGVDLVIAVTGLSLGVITMELYFSTLMLIYTTSLLTPPLIKHLLRQ